MISNRHKTFVSAPEIAYSTPLSIYSYVQIQQSEIQEYLSSIV